MSCDCRRRLQRWLPHVATSGGSRTLPWRPGFPTSLTSTGCSAAALETPQAASAAVAIDRECGVRRSVSEAEGRPGCYRTFCSGRECARFVRVTISGRSEIARSRTSAVYTASGATCRGSQSKRPGVCRPRVWRKRFVRLGGHHGLRTTISVVSGWLT